MEVINMNGCKLYIRIKASTEEEKFRIGDKIHEQLVGNKDYIDSNIVLNIEQPLTVRLWVHDECENIPEIHI